MLNKYFEKVYICKPYTSRLLNEESYIIGIHRNNLKYVKEERVKYYNNINKSIVEQFEKARNNIKSDMLSEVLKIMSKNKKLKYSKKYNKYVDEVRPLMRVLERL